MRLNMIWVRLVLSIVGAVIIAGAGLIHWATLEQRNIAIDQARYFANSVHQMTLAGLTGMMITGTIPLRPIFLDQIKEMHHVESLRVLRSDAVVRQYGPGLAGETALDAVEEEVIRSGQEKFMVVPGRDGDRLRAVIPARAAVDYLGKNCTNCHGVAPGTVLGAVSMEISLARVDETVRAFTRDAVLAALAVCVPLAAFIWFFISRMVSVPLRRMTEGLERIADGSVEDVQHLPEAGSDEVGIATRAFNKVMDKAYQLIDQERLSRIVFENSLEGITVTDAQGRIQLVNRAFTDTTGYPAAEAIGQTPALLKSGRQGEEFYAEFWKTLKETGEWRGEIWNRRRNGSVYPEWLNVSAVRNSRGEVEHYVAMFSDITERKQREEMIAHQAFHDALTGLPNRLLFQDRLAQALAQAKRHKGRTPAVMFLDLDRFKQINDTLGHDAGDALLREVAVRLSRCVRASDTVARLAGDEFTILLPECDSEAAAREVAEKVLATMREPVDLGRESRVITTSIGIALCPRDGSDAETLTKHADVAMYQVKRAGRAGLCFFGEAMAEGGSRRTEQEGRLRAALERQEFELHYQPIVDLVSGEVFAREALLRWRVDDGSLALPEEFLGLAEELGLMAEIGSWVLATACAYARRQERAGAVGMIAVNIGAAEFSRGDLAAMVRDTLRGAGVAPSNLVIEIGESLLMQDMRHSMLATRALAELGVLLAVDDFGTGYSNLVALKQLPLSFLKLDRSLLRERDDEGNADSVLGAAFAIARALGLRIVAEGVETDEQLARVRQIGCDAAQGTLLGPPIREESNVTDSR